MPSRATDRTVLLSDCAWFVTRLHRIGPTRGVTWIAEGSSEVGDGRIWYSINRETKCFCPCAPSTVIVTASLYELFTKRPCIGSAKGEAQGLVRKRSGSGRMDSPPESVLLSLGVGVSVPAFVGG